MPVLVVIVITVGTLLGLLSVMTNTAGLPSTTVALEMLTVGGKSLSTIVPVPTAVGFEVLVLVAVKVNVSVDSLVVSSVVGTFTITLVAPAGIITVLVTEV